MNDLQRSAKITLSNGYAYISEHNLRILKLYDWSQVLDIIEQNINEMRNTGILNTGRIELLYGFYMFDSFFTVSGIATNIGRTIPTTAPDASTSNTSLSMIGYLTKNAYGDGDKEISIKEYASRLVDLKKKWVRNDMCLGHVITDNNDEVDWASCFDQESPKTLYKLFSSMLNNFDWCDINNIIYTHSIYGIAYTNAVLRVSEYEDSNLTCICVPEFYVVYEEFIKIIKKYYFKGRKISDDIKSILRTLIFYGQISKE